MSCRRYRRRRLHRQRGQRGAQAEGHDVCVVDNLSKGHRDAVPERAFRGVDLDE